MSDGVKEMFERLDEEARQAELAKLNQHSDNDKLRTIKLVIQNLESLKRTDPALTESGWYYINDSLYELNSLLEG